MGQIYVSELFEKEEIKHIIKDTGCGLESIQLGISDNLDDLEETVTRVRSLLEFFEDPPLCVHGPFLDINPASFDSLARELTFRRFSEAYEGAKVLGADRIIFHSGMIPNVHFIEGWAEQTAAFWDEFLKGHIDMEVCVENVLDREIAPFRNMAERVSARHDNFGVCLDLGHAHCYSLHSPQEWIKELAPFIRHIHAHDNFGYDPDSRTRIDRHLALGDGNMDAGEILLMLRDLVPGVSVTAECNRPEDAYKTIRIFQGKADVLLNAPVFK